MEIPTILKKFKSLENPKAIEGMARFGIDSSTAYGVPIPELRKLAREIKKNHKLALDLWEINNHESKILATMIADPEKTTEALMDKWVKDFYSWDVCDQCIMNLFEKTPYVYKKAYEWSERNEEFVKRAGFVLMARLGFTDRNAEDKKLEMFFPVIKREARDERNFVKKAVNWAIRQIGKRNKYLNVKAIELSEEIRKMNSKSARWIANDALRELQSEAVRKRLKK